MPTVFTCTQHNMPDINSVSPTSPTHPNASPFRLESKPWLRAGISRSHAYALMAEGNWPRPVKAGQRASRWVSTEVDAWIQARMAARDTAIGRGV